jgi:FAD:protein FMN transferase
VVRRRVGESVGVRQPVLGTVAEVRVEARSARRRAAIEEAAFRALDELETQFSIFRPESELSRWRRGEVAHPSAELTLLLDAALHWQRASGGALNPAMGVVSRRWARAADNGVVPSNDELADLAALIVPPRYVDGRPVGDCSELTFHSLAKGLIVDLATQRAGVDEDSALVINVGGDLRRVGREPIVVGIEHPLRAYDNEPPLVRVRIGAGALATSGGARRGWTIAGRWFSHVIDPRNGRPVDHVASASVAAPDAMTADAVATVLSVLVIDEGLEFANQVELAACIVDGHGRVAFNDRWAAISAG